MLVPPVASLKVRGDAGHSPVVGAHCVSLSEGGCRSVVAFLHNPSSNDFLSSLLTNIIDCRQKLLLKKACTDLPSFGDSVPPSPCTSPRETPWTNFISCFLSCS